MADREYHASAGRELMRQIGVEKSQQEAFRSLLRTMVEEGEIRRLKGNRYRLAARTRMVLGRLQTHRDGYGFVVPDEGDGPDIYVRRRNMRGALHGDRVRVQVRLPGEGGRAEGRITHVVERAHHRLTGIFQRRKTIATVAPYGNAPYERVRIPAGEAGQAKDGMVVGVEISGRETTQGIPTGRIVEVMGWPDEPGMDLQLIIRKYDLRDAFPQEVLEEARAFSTTVEDADLQGREDFRELLTVTIDGESARDFDDAISIRTSRRQGYQLWVHIADVSHYVHEDTALDQEARARGTSVYFPERAIHMLPEALSTGICSLRPQVDRLCQTCVISLDHSGRVTSSRIVKSVIRSDHRLTYTTVAQCLENGQGAPGPDLLETFRMMADLCRILRARRLERGSIDFDLPEPVLLLDDRGEMTGITPLHRNVAHQIIEEFMLLANETVATFLVAQEWPAIFRVHDQPDPTKLEELDQIVRTFGYALPRPFEDITSKDIQNFLASVEGRPEADALQRIVLRSMMRARYSEVFGLHFGLATRRYLHFTSPIRRYPDLLVHRTLSQAAHWKAAPPEARASRRKRFHDFAEHASERERNADAAEWELIEWKKVAFMIDRVGERFDAIVSGVVSFGLFVELEDLYIDGLVHLSTLTDDSYRFVESKHLLVGAKTGRTFKIGDRVRVRVEQVNALSKRIDFRLVGRKGSRRRG